MLGLETVILDIPLLGATGNAAASLSQHQDAMRERLPTRRTHHSSGRPLQPRRGTNVWAPFEPEVPKLELDRA